MRTYYIFRINSINNTIHNKKKISIYKLLNRINNLSRKEYKIGEGIYKNIIIPLDKIKINNYILSNHVNDIYYRKEDNIHTLESGLERSKLIVNNTYIKIVTTNNIPTFFKDLFPIFNNTLCIDFDNKDYFYLDELELKLLV